MRLRGLLPAVVYLLVVAAPCAAAEYPVDQWRTWLAHASDRCPQQTWSKYATAEEAGWSTQKLAEARARFDELDSAAVLVIYDGAVLADWGDTARRYLCHSIRKSYLSALYGIHVDEGRIDLDKTLAELNVDDEPPLSDAEKQARVVDLLRARSGVYHPAAYETPRMKQQRPKRGSHRPGAFFWYNNWDFNALCTVFEQQTGTKLFEEYRRRFALPLQMQDFRLQDTYYHREPEHSIHPAYPFRMSARDMARFGLLMLRRGKWNGQQILSAQWVDRSTASTFRPADTTSNPQYGYGYLWWRIVDGPLKELGMYSARGYGGHAIDVLPVANLVVVHRVDTFWDVQEQFREKKDRVKDSQRFELLEMILRARVAPPKPDPKLVACRGAAERPGVIDLSASKLGRYVGHYDFKEFKLHVTAVNGKLLVGRPDKEQFSLLPLSETEFVIEDLEASVVFAWDDDGRPQMTVEFVPGKKWHGRQEPREPAHIDDPVAILAVLLGVLAGLFWFAAHPIGERFFKIIPLLVFAYFIPTALSNTGVIPLQSPLYEFIMDWLLPASLLLLTMSIDIPAILRLGPKVLILFLGGTATIVIGGPLAYLAVGWMLPVEMGDQAWRGLAALSGSWIGGGANFAAIGKSVHATDSTISMIAVIDVALANVWMAVLLFFAGRDERMDAAIGADRSSLDVLQKKIESFQQQVATTATLQHLLAILFIAFGGVVVATRAAAFFPDQGAILNRFAWTVIFVTVLGVAISYTPLRKLEGAGASKIGSLFLYLLIARIGAKAEFSKVLDAPALLLVAVVWIVFHAVVMLLLRRLLKAPIFYMAVGSQANIGGAASAPIVAGAFHPALAPVGVLMGVAGYVIGTAAGLLCAYLLRCVYQL